MRLLWVAALGALLCSFGCAKRRGDIGSNVEADAAASEAAAATPVVGDVIATAEADTVVGDSIATAEADTVVGDSIATAEADTVVGDSIAAAEADTVVGDSITAAEADAVVGDSIATAGADTIVKKGAGTDTIPAPAVAAPGADSAEPVVANSIASKVVISATAADTSKKPDMVTATSTVPAADHVDAPADEEVAAPAGANSIATKAVSAAAADEVVINKSGKVITAALAEAAAPIADAVAVPAADEATAAAANMTATVAAVESGTVPNAEAGNVATVENGAAAAADTASTKAPASKTIADAEHGIDDSGGAATHAPATHAADKIVSAEPGAAPDGQRVVNSSAAAAVVSTSQAAAVGDTVANDGSGVNANKKATADASTGPQTTKAGSVTTRHHSGLPLWSKAAAGADLPAWRHGSAVEAAQGWTVLRSPVSYALNASVERARLLLNGRRLLFIGDSVMKHQTMSLIHFLSAGTWMQPVAAISKDVREKYVGVGALLKQTESAQRHAPNIIHDCVPRARKSTARPSEAKSVSQHWWSRTCETGDAFPGTFISYSAWRGRNAFYDEDMAASGVRRCLLEPFLKARQMPPGTVERESCSAFQDCARGVRKRHCSEKAAIRLHDAEAIARLLAELQPDVLVINTGLWEASGEGNSTEAQRPVPPKIIIEAVASVIRDAIRERAERAAAGDGTPLRVIWKASTPTTDRRGAPSVLRTPCRQRALISAMLDAGAEFFDAYSLTAGLRAKGIDPSLVWYDENHFGPSVHAETNAALLGLLESGWAPASAHNTSAGGPAKGRSLRATAPPARELPFLQGPCSWPPPFWQVRNAN